MHTRSIHSSGPCIVVVANEFHDLQLASFSRNHDDHLSITPSDQLSHSSKLPSARAAPATTKPILPTRCTETAALLPRRPVLPRRSLTTIAMTESRPSFLSRIGLSGNPPAPAAPSHWTEAAHARHLIRLWDALEERAPHASIATRLASAEKNMLHSFPELGKGPNHLSREWIEYRLGLALRHPFCTQNQMGRWEVLASSSGARGTWGPW